MRATRRSMIATTAVGGAAAAMGAPARAVAEGGAPSPVRHRTLAVEGVHVFYREAGPADAPVILLLHGFANSSFYFRHLMPRLAGRYRLIAPDMPSFGFTVVPPELRYDHTFASLSRTMGAFVDALGLRRFALYVFDYGAPVGFNLALDHPDRITGIISQNGNAYEDGLGEAAWAPLRAYWARPSQGPREAIRSRLSLEGVRAAYVHGVPDPSVIEPEAYTLDAAILARPGNDEVQIDLKLDYNANIARYPLYQAYFREHRPPLLAVWGRNDPFFIPPGAAAFKRDIPDARVRLLDTGHFALETNLDDIAAEISAFRVRA